MHCYWVRINNFSWYLVSFVKKHSNPAILILNLCFSGVLFAVHIHEAFPEICTFVQGDAKSLREERVGSADNQEKCVALVKEKAPRAAGVTYGSNKKCFAEFGVTGLNPSSTYKTCKFGCKLFSISIFRKKFLCKQVILSKTFLNYNFYYTFSGRINSRRQ